VRAWTLVPERKQGRFVLPVAAGRDSRGTSGARRARIGPVAQSVDEERDHALAVRDSFVRHGQAQTGDGVQEILRAGVGTNLATGCRGFKQQSEGGSKPPPEVTGQFVGRLIPGSRMAVLLHLRARPL
jgi:hypothetical protein